MGDPSLRARPGHEDARAYGGGPVAIAGPGATGAQGVSTVVQGTEKVDYPTMRGSAARVPPARTVTPTCTKEVRSGKKVIGKGKGSKGQTPGGPDNIAITNAPWHTDATPPVAPPTRQENVMDQRTVRRFQRDFAGTDSDQDSNESAKTCSDHGGDTNHMFPPGSPEPPRPYGDEADESPDYGESPPTPTGGEDLGDPILADDATISSAPAH